MQTTRPIQIGEHVYEAPLPPSGPIKIKGSLGEEWEIPLSELILNLHSSSADAYWKRDILPDIFYKYLPDETKIFADETLWDEGVLVSLSDKDTKTLIYLMDRELHRRRNGVWFRNDTEIVYLTGHHYFFLQWMKLYGMTDKLLREWRPKGYQYGDYYEFQRDVFYLIDKCWNDDDILGMFIAKPKKTGITQLFAAYYLNKATMTRDAQMGIMSKGAGASETNMLFVVKGFEGLPPIFQPNLKERADKEGKLFFGESALRNVRTAKGKERRKKLLDANPLDTKVYAAKTKEAAFDSPVMQDICFDEFPKYWSENQKEPEIIFNRNLDSVKIQEVYNGRAWIMTYPPEEDDKGFLQARKIYFNSKLSTIKPGEKRTKTGLIAHYISAIYSYRSCFDKYGRCDEVKAHRINQEERNKVKDDTKAYQAKIRQYSETEKECWQSAGAGSTFDNIRLGALKYKLEEEMKHTRFFEDGKLVWENVLWEAGAMKQRPKKNFCGIKFVPLTKDEIAKGVEGRLRIYQRIPKMEVCAALRMGRDDWGNLLPLSTFNYFGGTDPTDLAADAHVIQGSKNASFTFNMPSMVTDSQYGRVASKIPISVYFYRPNNPQEFYEDLVKEILYFGKRVIVEANNPWVSEQLIQDGLGNYMLIKNKETGAIEPWTQQLENQKKVSLIHTITDTLQEIVKHISTYIVEPTDEYGKDYGAQIKDERLLDQLMNFSKKESNIYDLVMAFGWALICGEIMLAAPELSWEQRMYDGELVGRLYAGLTT